MDGSRQSPEAFTPKDNVLVITRQTEKGKRSENQDALAFGDDWAIVADGVSKSNNPAKASHAAAYKTGLGLAAIDKSTHVDDVAKRMVGLFAEANRQAQAEDGMTTLTAVKVVEDKSGRRYAVIANVGDSRAYLLREGEIRQITQDDRLEGRTNVLTNVIGGSDGEPEVHTHIVALDLGDKLILVTDGVHENLTNDELAEIAVKGEAEDIVAAAADKVENWIPKRYNDDRTAVVVALKRPVRRDAVGEAVDVLAKMEGTRRQLRNHETTEEFWKLVDDHYPGGTYIDSKGVERTIPQMKEIVGKMVEMVRSGASQSQIHTELNQLTTDPDIRFGIMHLLGREEKR